MQPPDKRFHRGTGLYFIGRFFIRIFCRLLCRWDVAGRENLPATGPVIIAPNHISYFDPPVLGSALPRPTYFMAKEELFEVPVLGWIIPRTRAYPVRRGVPDRKALRWTFNLLEKGQMVMMFPEGTRSKTGEPQEPETGISYVILKARVPVVPMAVVGTNRLFLPGKPLPRFGRLRVRIGKPITFEQFYEKATRDDHVRIAQSVMKKIRALREDICTD